MLKKILAFVMMFYAAFCFAAVDANKASAAELDGIKGVGPAISAKIIEERTKSAFKDWSDLISRVKGIGEKSAAKLSAAGLTVGGSAYKDATPTPAAAKKDDKPTAPAPVAAKKDDKPAAPASAAAKKEEKPAKAAKDSKADAKAAKSAPASAPTSAASAAKK